MAETEDPLAGVPIVDLSNVPKTQHTDVRLRGNEVVEVVAREPISYRPIERRLEADDTKVSGVSVVQVPPGVEIDFDALRRAADRSPLRDRYVAAELVVPKDAEKMWREPNAMERSGKMFDQPAVLNGNRAPWSERVKCANAECSATVPALGSCGICGTPAMQAPEGGQPAP